MAMILIVDDDQAITDMLTLYLEGEGFQVQVAHDGEEGLILAKQLKPDLMILDLNMPKMKGAGVFSSLHDASGKTLFPVIVVTGQGDVESIYSDLGIQAFFTKPPNMTHLIDKIRELIGQKTGEPPASDKTKDPASAPFKFKSEELSSVNLSRLSGKIEKQDGLPDEKNKNQELGPVASKVPVEGIDWKRKHHIKNVIVVENDEKHFRRIQTCFKAGPYNLICVKSKDELMILLKSLLPDLVLVKLEMPDMSGHDMILEIRHNSHIKFFPVLLYTHLNNHRIKAITFESVMKGTFHMNGLKDLVETDDVEIIYKRADALLKEIEAKKTK